MNKLICIPVEHYNNLLHKEPENGVSDKAIQVENEEMGRVKNKNGDADLKKATKATIKTQEIQELLQRKREYKDADEEIPKSLDKPMPQKATTLLPPPHLREKKKKNPTWKEIDKLLTDTPPKKRKVVKKASKTFTLSKKKVESGIGPWKFIQD